MENMEFKTNEYFSDNQVNAQRVGANLRQSLIENTKQAARIAQNASFLDPSEKRDTILSGPTGIGKTENMNRAFAAIGYEKGKDYVSLSGDHSMTGFAIKLMMAHREFQLRKKEGETLIVMVDDCDSFFQSKDARNKLKGMMGATGTRELQYNKLLPEHMLTDRQHATLEHYRNTDGSPGFTIPCEDVAFVFTTNFVFPTERQAKLELAKGLTNRALSFQDLTAIRSRVNLKPFHMNMATNWGWLAEVALNDGLLDMMNDLPDPEYSKYQLLDFIATKWEQMTESNLRTVQAMGYLMKKHGNKARSFWNTDYIVQNQEMITL